MHLFYDPRLQSPPAQYEFQLSKEESGHAVKVLRLREKDIVHLVNGSGSLFTASVENADPKATVLKLLTSVNEYHRRNHYLHIAVAPTKNIERLEWFLEKATEIGIDEITPVICEHSERKEVKTGRLLKVMIAAMKQSLKAYLPKLNEPVKLGEFLKDGGSDAVQRFMAHCGDGERVALKSKALQRGNYVVLIGPEGDFSDNEISLSAAAGYVPVTLGTSRLRTETAALEACFELNYINRADS